MTNLAELLTHAAARSPEATAVKLDDLELTYAELDEAAAPRGRPAARPRACGPATASG